MEAFVPIKSHSERVPGKNFKQLGNKPLFMWIIEALLGVEGISKITIDTDSDNAQLWALNSNPRINLKQRNPLLLGDFTSMNEIIWDHLKESNNGDFLMTHATNPFLSKTTIESAISTFYAQKIFGYDSVFTVSVIQGRLFDSEGLPLNHDPSSLVRTQDLSPVFMENSCLYLFDKSSFTLNKSRIGVSPYRFIIPSLESIDIDSKEDWDLAHRVAFSLIHEI